MNSHPNNNRSHATGTKRNHDEVEDAVSIAMDKADALIERVKKVKESGARLLEVDKMINAISIELDLKKMDDIRSVREKTNMLINTEKGKRMAKVEEVKEVQREILKLQQRSMAIQADIKKMNAAKPAKIAKIKAEEHSRGK